MNKMIRHRIKTMFLLHIMLMIYSMSGIASKKAAEVPLLSAKFCVYYGIVIFLLIFYAIGWQQVIKKLPLTTAFANKAVTVVWGVIWGVLFFGENITIGKIVGALLVVVGVVVYAYAEQGEQS